MAGINERLTGFDCYYYDGVAAPDTTTVTGTELRTEIEGIGGGQEVRIIAATEVTFPTTSNMTITLQDATEEGGTYADVQELYNVTASGTETITAGTVIAKTTLPVGIRAWTQLEIVTTGTATGTVTGFVAYVPR